MPLVQFRLSQEQIHVLPTLQSVPTAVIHGTALVVLSLPYCSHSSRRHLDSELKFQSCGKCRWLFFRDCLLSCSDRFTPTHPLSLQPHFLTHSTQTHILGVASRDPCHVGTSGHLNELEHDVQHPGQGTRRRRRPVPQT
jgi:hypothetical protein